MALAYIGNRSGLDVLDYRGGMSQTIFASKKNMLKIAGLQNVKSKTVKHYNDFKAVGELLKDVKNNKEYYLTTGSHAAIIRKGESGFEYLELQDPQYNGFKKLTDRALKRRFDCKTARGAEGTSILIDSESLYGNSEFKKILGYINTASKNQIKGMSGNVR